MNLLNNFKLGRKNEYEVNLGLRSVEVHAEVRRLRVTWTPEMEFVGTNIETYYNLDAERELTRMLSEEMVRMVADEIVRVQPLNTPIGELFYFDYRHINLDSFKFGR